MRHVTCMVAIGTLATAIAGCADPYAPRSGYSQSYSYPSVYGYPATSSYPAGYYPTRYGYGYGYGSGYGSGGDYYRNYSGSRSGPQVTLAFP